MSSTKFFSRARTSESQRGYALVTALALAILYFSLMELLLLDSSRAQAEAQRFRVRVMAAAMAESGAERAALDMVSKTNSKPPDYVDAQGTTGGTCTRNGDTFLLEGHATAKGVMEQSATVTVQGRIENGVVKIDYSVHGQ